MATRTMVLNCIFAVVLCFAVCLNFFIFLLCWRRRGKKKEEESKSFVEENFSRAFFRASKCS